MNLFDLHHPFFAPMWRRVVVVLFCAGWSLFEVVTGQYFWACVFAGMGALAAWQFYVRPPDHWNGPPGQD